MNTLRLHGEPKGLKASRSQTWGQIYLQNVTPVKVHFPSSYGMYLRSQHNTKEKDHFVGGQ